MSRPLFVRVSSDRTVEAEQVQAGSCPEGVEEVFYGASGRTAFTMKTAFGRLLIPPGTWIVYDDEGVRPVAKDVFERVYVPVTVGGRAVGEGEAKKPRLLMPWAKR